MASYLYAVQDHTGREIVSAHVDVQKVSDVTAKREGEEVSLVFEDIVIQTGRADADLELTLHRWPSTDKLAADANHVSHPVK